MPKVLRLGWVLFNLSDGNIEAQEKLKDWTTEQVLERLLYRQIKSLKELEAMPKKR